MSLTFIVIVLLLNIMFCSSTKHDVVIVLGSSDEGILNERIDATIQYINSVTSPIIVYISGGVKYATTNDSSEASKIISRINQEHFEHVQLVVDEYATNTAENFTYFKHWVSQYFSHDELPQVIITTSDFHQNRAQLIFQNIIDDITPQWNLSKSSCIHCWNDETIHLKNIPSDVIKARRFKLPRV